MLFEVNSSEFDNAHYGMFECTSAFAQLRAKTTVHSDSSEEIGPGIAGVGDCDFNKLVADLL